MPLVGSRASTTLMLKNAWISTAVVMPKARKRANGSGRKKCRTETTIASATKADDNHCPIRPSSSHTFAKMKSCAARQIEQLLPALHQAETVKAAVPTAISDCRMWKPVPRIGLGSTKANMRARRHATWKSMK